MANAALAGQIETRVNAWRHRTPMKGDAVKAIDGWVRDAGIAGESDAAAILRQAVAVAERVGTVKSVAPWDEVIAELDAAVKSLRGITTKADDELAVQKLRHMLVDETRQGQLSTMLKHFYGTAEHKRKYPNWTTQTEQDRMGTAEELDSIANEALSIASLFASSRPRAFLKRFADGLKQSANYARQSDFDKAAAALRQAHIDLQNAQFRRQNRIGQGRIG